MKVIRNVGRADAVINFIEQLPITIGEDAGKRFKLRPFQVKFIRDIYEPADGSKPSKRLVRRAVLSVARKNGKSELAAALILVHLIGPESEPNGEIYSAANDREQAAIVFNAVRRMVEFDPRLQQIVTVVQSTKTIFVKRSDLKCAGSKFRALSAEAGTKHGLNPSFIIYDELAQAKSRELLDTLTTSQGARSEPLFLTISTQSHDAQHPLTEMIEDGRKGEDPTVVAHLHAADDGCDLLDEAQWLKANPALGDFRSLDELRLAAHRAVRLPSEEQAFRLLYLNQRVSRHSSLIAAPDWKACHTANAALIPGEAIFLAYDGAIRTDLAALVATSVEDGSRVAAWFFKPSDYLEEHSKRDYGDASRYARLAKEGWLEAVPGRSIDPMAVALKVGELHRDFDVRGLAYDRWKIDEFLRCLDSVGLAAQENEGAGLRVVPWGQGFKDMAPAIDAFEHAVLTGELKHNGNPILTTCVLNAQAITDPSGNRKLDKAKSFMRIDGAVALAMALGLKTRDRAVAAPLDPWADPEYSLSKQYA